LHDLKKYEKYVMKRERMELKTRINKKNSVECDKHFTSFPEVLWNCHVWHLGPQGADSNLTSAGASLLDYNK
jgi:hypothetical protein